MFPDAWGIEPVQCNSSKHTSCSDINRSLQPIERPHVDVEKDGVVIGVPIVGINSLETLWELDVCEAVATLVHEEAHGLPKCEGIEDVMITIEIEDERAVGHDSAGAHKSIHSSSLLVVVIAWSLLTRHIDQHRQTDIDVRGVDNVFLITAAHQRLAGRRSKHHLHR